MGEVIQFYIKTPHEKAKDIIIDNLKDKHHSKWVNFLCAVEGIDDWADAQGALTALIREEIVEKWVVNLETANKKATRAALYRYNAIRGFIADQKSSTTA